MTRRPPADLNIVARYYARWSPHEDKRREIAEDHKEMFAEAKAEGLNPKALRKAFAEQYRVENQTADQAEKRNETDADVELYLTALARVREDDAFDHVPDPATKAKRSAALDALAAMDAEIIDAETGVIIEPQHGLRADTAAQTVQPHAAVADSEALSEAVESSVGGEGDGNPLPVSHSSSQAIEGLSSPFTRHGWATSSAGTEGEADRRHIPDHSKPNPICRDPDDCGVYASWHLPCRACLKAAEAAA